MNKAGRPLGGNGDFHGLLEILERAIGWWVLVRGKDVGSDNRLPARHLDCQSIPFYDIRSLFMSCAIAVVLHSPLPCIRVRVRASHMSVKVLLYYLLLSYPSRGTRKQEPHTYFGRRSSLNVTTISATVCNKSGNFFQTFAFHNVASPSLAGFKNS